MRPVNLWIVFGVKTSLKIMESRKSGTNLTTSWSAVSSQAAFPIPQPPNELLEGLGKIGSLFHPPPDQKLSHWGEEEEQKEKQEYWEKELEKMDEKEKK